MIKKISVSTRKRDEIIDLTPEVREFIKETGFEEGIAVIYSAHTTAGITINENADPDVKTDFLRMLDEIFPWNHELDLHAEGNTAAHLKTSFTGPSQQVIVHKGNPILGTWQGIYFCEFDGPRERQVYITLLGK
ncbi:secondary thiamine-phosphate synthase enzyme [Bacillus sp. OV322]|uniref:secondary thiamine-phosphate synthase enzyme YjbQ n=1 Tax=Bacillus sp. OV322 TaxID=1882764 RepID=UPI0008E1C837|nr:secondary thiamine-phosphate synthase enzyme YjbQ [Bacillus sp. OV322]SFC77806.1 secondary thiamine-phosphate synthase enzyme [Bacillus sp. OV322]